MLPAMRRLYPRGAASRGVCVDADGATLGPDWLYEQGRRIADALNRGEIALAQIYGLRIPIGDIDQRQLKRLAAAADLRKAGFNPDEPRIPAGRHGGGEWTTDDGSADGASVAIRDSADASTAPIAIRYLDQQNGAGTHDGSEGLPAQVIPAAYMTARRQSDGNQSADDSMTGERNLEAYLIQAGYQFTPQLWAAIRQLYRFFMDYGRDLADLMEYLAENGINLDELPAVIRSAFDQPRPLSELQTDKPPAGFSDADQLKAYLGAALPGYEWHHIIEQTGQFRPDLTSPEGI